MRKTWTRPRPIWDSDVSFEGEVEGPFIPAIGGPWPFEKFPPLQAPESYNLSGIEAEVKKAVSSHPSD